MKKLAEKNLSIYLNLPAVLYRWILKRAQAKNISIENEIIALLFFCQKKCPEDAITVAVDIVAQLLRREQKKKGRAKKIAPRNSAKPLPRSLSKD